MERKQLGAEQLFAEYYADWIEAYKCGAVRAVTYSKYLCAAKKLVTLAPNLKVGDLDKRAYQQIMNAHSVNHSRQTTYDFNNLLKSAIRDAVDEKTIPYDPTKNVVVKDGEKQHIRKKKYLNADECKKLVSCLDLQSPIRLGKKQHPRGMIHKTNWDWLFLLCVKTGMRVSEALGTTPADFDFEGNTVSINKTYDYKFTHGLLLETKTSSSVRKILIDCGLAEGLKSAMAGIEKDEPIFVSEGQRVYITTVNERLCTLCDKAGVPQIATHGLRHTHASILFYNGVSVQSISRRLGHASTAITQSTYLHIIKELEDEDNAKMLSGLASI